MLYFSVTNSVWNCLQLCAEIKALTGICTKPACATDRGLCFLVVCNIKATTLPVKSKRSVHSWADCAVLYGWLVWTFCSRALSFWQILSSSLQTFEIKSYGVLECINKCGEITCSKSIRAHRQPKNCERKCEITMILWKICNKIRKTVDQVLSGAKAAFLHANSWI